MSLPRILPLSSCGIALIACQVASADTKVSVINKSLKPWIIRVVPNGKKTGGSLEVNGKRLGNWEGFPIAAGKTVEVNFSYTASYCVRFQIIDQFGNWAELGSELTTTQRFSSSKRYQNLYNSIGDPGFAMVSAAIKTDVPKNGDITISKDNLAASTPPAQEYTGPKPSKIDATPPPFFSTYLFNRTAGNYSLQLTQGKVPKGKLIITTEDGRILAEFNRDANATPQDNKTALPRGIFRMVLVPDKSGTHTTDVTLLDALSHGGRMQFWYKKDEGGALQFPFDQKAEFQSYVTLNDYKEKRSLQVNGFPGEVDITLVKDAFPTGKGSFPESLVDKANMNNK
jgi:hypothetical protein